VVRAGWVVLSVCGLAASGCTSYQRVDWDGRGSWAAARHAGPGGAANGSGHRVASGETLSELAQRYRVPMGALARLNGISAPYTLYAGQVLALPRDAAEPATRPTTVAATPAPARRPQSVAVRELPPPKPRPAAAVQVASLDLTPVVQRVAPPPPLPRGRLGATSRGTTADRPPPLTGNGFVWPVRGKLASSFGGKPDGTRNDGINIRAPEGTPVVAAENGVVVFAGDEIPGYGNMLLISHADGFMTAYAHNRDVRVSIGQRVERGQRVASVGRTGNVGSPQLHFELRDGKEPVDPVALLDSGPTQLASAR
jgi:murein DD-endopeptidase MepM/ murein hydrolase activator NlpD